MYHAHCLHHLAWPCALTSLLVGMGVASAQLPPQGQSAVAPFSVPKGVAAPGAPTQKAVLTAIPQIPDANALRLPAAPATANRQAVGTAPSPIGLIAPDAAGHAQRHENDRRQAIAARDAARTGADRKVPLAFTPPANLAGAPPARATAIAAIPACDTQNNPGHCAELTALTQACSGKQTRAQLRACQNSEWDQRQARLPDRTKAGLQAQK